MSSVGNTCVVVVVVGAAVVAVVAVDAFVAVALRRVRASMILARTGCGAFVRRCRGPRRRRSAQLSFRSCGHPTAGGGGGGGGGRCGA